MASSSFFKILGIDNIYTTQEIPCVGGFETGYYDPEEYEVRYEVTREEDNTTYIVLKGKLGNIKQYFYDAFESEDEDFKWDDYKPTQPPFKYPRLEYYNFSDDVPYDEITTSDIYHRSYSYWCEFEDDGTFTVEAIEKDINTPGAIIKFNGEDVEMPTLTRGFFNENLNEKIDRIWNTNAQIEQVMEDDELSLDEKSQILFKRTPEHVFDFGMCSYRVQEPVRKIAQENNGTTSVDAHSTYLPAKAADVDVCTVMCLGDTSEPFNLQESWDWYVKQRPSKYRGGMTRSHSMSPINWYKYLKAVIEAFEDAANYTDTPPLKRGFFDESNQNNLREEMEKKVIGSGHGWRVVCRKFSPVSWDRTRYKSGTVVVRLPHPGREYFMCTSVVTAGISGQPQLTFDDPAKAQEYCDKLNRISSTYRFEVSKTRADYECYKIPLRDGTEAWLATSNFPPQGSPKWKYLCDLFPDYFKNITRGFFDESLTDGNPSDDEITEIIKNDNLSDDEVCEKLFGGRNQEYILKACHSHCSWFVSEAPDGAWTPQCHSLGVTCPFIINNFSERPLTIRESYQAYVENEEINGARRWKASEATDWWKSIVELYTFWEKHDPENFPGPVNHSRRGFFDEALEKEE